MAACKKSGKSYGSVSRSWLGAPKLITTSQKALLMRREWEKDAEKDGPQSPRAPSGRSYFERRERRVDFALAWKQSNNLLIVSISFFVTEKKNKPVHLFWFNGTSAECFGNWERNLTTAALALWQI